MKGGSGAGKGLIGSAAALHDHRTPAANPRHAQRLNRRCTPPPRLVILRWWPRGGGDCCGRGPGQHCCKSCAGAVRGGLAGTGCDHTKTVESTSGPSATRGAPGILPGAHSRGFELLWRAWQKCGGARGQERSGRDAAACHIRRFGMRSEAPRAPPRRLSFMVVDPAPGRFGVCPRGVQPVVPP